MMGKIYTFVLGMAAGFGMYHLALSYHVIRASDGLHLTPKVAATLTDTYIDIREFTAADHAEHPQVIAAVLNSGDAELQKQLLGDAIQVNGFELPSLLNQQPE